MPAPANDLCVNAIVIPALPYTLAGVDLTSATESLDDPKPGVAGSGIVNPGDTAIFQTIWYQWACGSSGPVKVTTTAGIVCGIFTGSCGSFTEVLSWDTALVFPAVAGTTYTFMFGSYSGGATTFDLAITTSTDPANQWMIVAEDVVLPAALSPNVSLATSDAELWYRYTGQTGDQAIGAFAFGALVGHNVQVDVFTSPVNYYSPASWPAIGLTATNKPIQLPITAAQTVYLRLRNASGSGACSFAVDAAPNLPVAAGSFLINDDTAEFPLAILNGTTGTVLRFVNPFPHGEAGETLTDGTLAFEDATTGTVALYTSSAGGLSLVGSFGAYSTAIMLSTNRTTLFYVGTPGAGATHASVKPMSPAGVFGSVIGPFGAAGLTGLAPARDDSVLYYTGQSSSLNAAVKQWNLATNTGLADLASGNGATYATGDLLVLSDDSVVVTFYKATATTDTVVKRYDASGSLLNTYNFGALNVGTRPRLAAAIDETTFWIWLHLTTGFSRFINVKASDGSTVADFTALTYEVGVSAEAATATPTARFGHSQSCPLVVFRSAIINPPVYHVIERVIRRLRRAPHITQNNKRIFVNQFELILQPGVGTVVDPGVDPQVMLRVSYDAGKTWEPEQQMSAGELGHYRKRVIARQLGQGRDLVFEVTVSDPVAWYLTEAFLEIEQGLT